jgi:hypothetical protein
MTGFSRMTQGTSGLTPRNRQEIEAPSLLQSRQEIPLVRAQTTFTTILTARADAYFLTDGVWMANVTGAGHTLSVCLVAPAGSATVGPNNTCDPLVEMDDRAVFKRFKTDQLELLNSQLSNLPETHPRSV